MTTRKGFIFDQSLCVSCKACSAACNLENNFSFPARTIYSYNERAVPDLAVYHLSIACNHCEAPICMTGCPAAAIERDISTNALIINKLKCLGCNYCVWNCPYDAPRYDSENRIAGKCNLCYTRVGEGYQPACSVGCPTGALQFGEIESLRSDIMPEWLKDFGLNAALRFIEPAYVEKIKIVPETDGEKNIVTGKNGKSRIEWSLVLFSFSATIAVAIVLYRLITGTAGKYFPDLLITFLPGLFSLFHLGKPLRAWRAITNPFNSPLSREIILYLLFISANAAFQLLQIPVIQIVAAITGLSMLVSVDAVYYYSSKSIRTYLHSGQTFLSALLIASFMIGELKAFTFIVLIKFVLSAIFLKAEIGNIHTVIIRFTRIALLIIASASIITGISYPEPSIILILLAGEFLDRILFYIDFKPQSISDDLNKIIYTRIYETHM
jgi:Fe-S-cluster-containing dehydrogenase component/DMSO reductase anchor subunit